MKKFKRNAVIITVLLFVCVAVYLNWSYGRDEDDASALTETEATTPSPSIPSLTEDGEQQDPSGMYYEGETEQTSVDTSVYFDQVRLNRQQARDEATATLETVTTAEGASQETVDQALSEMTTMADWAVTESEIESLIMAKGYSDCVVYISGDGITVTVPAPEEGLSSSAVARITDAVTNETDFAATDLKIVEIK